MSTQHHSDRDPSLDSYVTELLHKRNIASFDLSNEEIESMKSDLYDDIDLLLKERIVGVMSDEEALAFADLVSEGDDEAIQSYLTKAIPDMESLISTTLMEFQTHYLR